MDILSNLVMGLQVAAEPYNLITVVVGLILGVIIGVLPGLGGANGCAILIPITFIMPPVAAVILLASVYWGSLYGGCICSILFNIPGEPWAVASTFDGYPMAKKGRAGMALSAAFFAHFVGAVFGTILLTFFAPLLAAFALRFGPPEVFAVMLLTFSAFVGLVGKSPVKTIVSTALGFILAAVGIDIVSGELRMNFGLVPLMGGFNFIVAVIGLFGIGEIFLTVEEGLKIQGIKVRMRRQDITDTLKAMLQYRRVLALGAIVGVWMGFKPGGATPASFMAYGFAKAGARSGEQEEFGKGHIAGIFAPEAAAHGAGTSAMIPMITLGIPGSPTAAVILGGLMIWGLQPGPMLFKDNPDFVWGLFGSTWIANFLGLFVVLAFAPLFAAVLRAPFPILMPLLIFICAIGAYAVNNRMIDIWYMMIFGVIGWAFKKLDYNMAPMLLALVLGDMAESAMRQSLIMSQGSLWIFVQPPIALPLVIAAALIFFWPWLGPMIRRLRAKEVPAKA
ncbi:MAG TPA: tripartite tricarboxylate transporter permease [Candidatus Methylomirabilis sp.]|nr:tripartite tricarboxylate transporter permease [Candidatus Methylomirabilis sp.]